jgi:hypothetical protein
MKLAATPTRALLSLLWRRALLRLRGLGFTERAESAVPAEDLARIDLCWSVSVGLSIVDTIRGADFQTRHLILALRAGEPYRVARALAMEVGYSATRGSRTRARTARVQEMATALAERCGNPHAVGLAALAVGIAACLEGRWKIGAEVCDRAEQVLIDGCTGVVWEVGSARTFAIFNLFYLGELKEMTRRGLALLEREQQHGDVYAATNLRSGLSNFAFLTVGDPGLARRELDVVRTRLSRKEFHLHHYYDMLARAQIDLYEGKGRDACDRLAAEWPALKRSLILEIQHVSIVMHHIRARAALAAAAAAPPAGREDLLAAAAADARRLEKPGLPWASTFALLLRAGVAHLRGDAPGAVSRLEAAATAFDAADMKGYAAAARWRLGALKAGDAGRALANASETFFRDQAVKEPARVLAVLAPGF